MQACISRNRHDGPGALAFERFVEAMAKAGGLADPDEAGLRRMAQQLEEIKQVFRERALGQSDVQADAVPTTQEKVSCTTCSLWSDEERRCKVETDLAGDALIARVLAEGCNVYSKRGGTQMRGAVGTIRQASVVGDVKREASPVVKPKPRAGFTVRNASQRIASIRKGGVL